MPKGQNPVFRKPKMWNKPLPYFAGILNQLRNAPKPPDDKDVPRPLKFQKPKKPPSTQELIFGKENAKLINGMTNWQCTKWLRAGGKPGQVKKYAAMERRPA